ncbi:hypothetical protein ACIGHB_10580 [Streptomyces sp. NPDC085460]|uniref:hypothetical protein n=1 Tax=Streptomyces sp. NPDC085460 TaxID=3365723 RepID=UPI0037CF0C17
MRRRKQQPVLAAVALCLGGALTACGGGGDGEGFAAVGAGPSPGGAVGPSGAVTLVPLDSPTASGTTSSTSSPPPAPESPPGASPSPGAGTSTPSAPRTRQTGSGGPDAGSGSGTGQAGGSGGRTESAGPPGGPSGGGPSEGASPGGGSSPRPATTPPRTPGPGPAPTTPAPRPTVTTTPPPPGPAVLTVSAPVTADGEKRWCERVTVTFRNTGGSPVAAGTATFATHVIGALGVDWGTVTTSQALPAPIAPGAARTETYTVCVESWRVPLGMRVDTREVTATWR